MTRIELENVAVMFRTGSANLGHVSVFDMMKEAGLGHAHGCFMSIPKHHRKKRKAMAEQIAVWIDEAAKAWPKNGVFPPGVSREALECIQCLTGVVEDMLPQIGKIVLQDYARLNRGLILSSQILKGKE